MRAFIRLCADAAKGAIAEQSRYTAWLGLLAGVVLLAMSLWIFRTGLYPAGGTWWLLPGLARIVFVFTALLGLTALAFAIATLTTKRRR
jgi:hypothetical protein